LPPDKELREEATNSASKEPLPPAPNREELLAAQWIKRELPPRDHLLGALVTARVMYLDGEMPQETFQERMRMVTSRYWRRPLHTHKA
jgi:hypothetical protein